MEDHPATPQRPSGGESGASYPFYPPSLLEHRDAPADHDSSDSSAVDPDKSFIVSKRRRTSFQPEGPVEKISSFCPDGKGGLLLTKGSHVVDHIEASAAGESSSQVQGDRDREISPDITDIPTGKWDGHEGGDEDEEEDDEGKENRDPEDKGSDEHHGGKSNGSEASLEDDEDDDNQSSVSHLSHVTRAGRRNVQSDDNRSTASRVSNSVQAGPEGDQDDDNQSVVSRVSNATQAAAQVLMGMGATSTDYFYSRLVWIGDTSQAVFRQMNRAPSDRHLRFQWEELRAMQTEMLAAFSKSRHADYLESSRDLPEEYGRKRR